MAAHTKEPWRVDGNTGAFSVEAEPHKMIVAVRYLGNAPAREAEEEANARRIVACVNACAGIPTDVLEAATGTDTARFAALEIAAMVEGVRLAGALPPDPLLSRITEGALDDAVDDEKSAERAGINNEGAAAQLAYLRANGWTDAAILAAIGEG